MHRRFGWICYSAFLAIDVYVRCTLTFWIFFPLHSFHFFLFYFNFIYIILNWLKHWKKMNWFLLKKWNFNLKWKNRNIERRGARKFRGKRLEKEMFAEIDFFWHRPDVYVRTEWKFSKFKLWATHLIPNWINFKIPATGRRNRNDNCIHSESAFIASENVWKL